MESSGFILIVVLLHCYRLYYNGDVRRVCGEPSADNTAAPASAVNQPNEGDLRDLTGHTQSSFPWASVYFNCS